MDWYKRKLGIPENISSVWRFLSFSYIPVTFQQIEIKYSFSELSKFLNFSIVLDWYNILTTMNGVDDISIKRYIISFLCIFGTCKNLHFWRNQLQTGLTKRKLSTVSDTDSDFDVRNKIIRSGSRKMAIWAMFSDFTENSTLHGVKYVGKRKRHWIERAFWVIAVLSSFLVCSYMIYKVKYKFFYTLICMHNIHIQDLHKMASSSCYWEFCSKINSHVQNPIPSRYHLSND